MQFCTIAIPKNASIFCLLWITHIPYIPREYSSADNSEIYAWTRSHLHKEKRKPKKKKSPKTSKRFLKSSAHVEYYIEFPRSRSRENIRRVKRLHTETASSALSLSRLYIYTRASASSSLFGYISAKCSFQARYIGITQARRRSRLRLRKRIKRTARF